MKPAPLRDPLKLISAIRRVDELVLILSILLGFTYVAGFVIQLKPGIVTRIDKAEFVLFISRIAIAILLGLALLWWLVGKRVRGWLIFRRHEAAAEECCYRSRVALISDLPDLATMEHHASESSAWRESVSGRQQRKEELYEGNPLACRVLEYDRANGDRPKLVGGATIVRLTDDAYAKYRVGTLDQYHLKKSDLIHPSQTLETKDGVPLYVQSFYVIPEHRDLRPSVGAQFRMATDHIAELLASYPGRRFYLLAEEFAPGVDELIEVYGFAPTGVLSPRGHEIYSFDSLSPQKTRLGELLVREVNRRLTLQLIDKRNTGN